MAWEGLVFFMLFVVLQSSKNSCVIDDADTTCVHIAFNLFPTWTYVENVGINERLITLRLKLTTSQFAKTVSTYASMLQAGNEVKALFYSALDNALNPFPSKGFPIDE